MDTMSAFSCGLASKGQPSMVFDWDKAAKLIKDSNVKHAEAGLENDWEWTGGVIFHDGKPMKKEDTYTYLASKWAIPQLKIKDKLIECYKMKSKTKGWDQNTYWPDSALQILGFSMKDLL